MFSNETTSMIHILMLTIITLNIVIKHNYYIYTSLFTFLLNSLSDFVGFLAWVVRKVDNAIHWINHYPVDSVVCFFNIYPLDSDLSGG